MFKKNAVISLICTALVFTPMGGIASLPPATQSLNLNLPSMGAVAGTELSPREEQALGDEMMLHIRADDSYLNDAETLEYLNRLGYRLVSVSQSHTYNFFFYPLLNKTLNAFAIPGGYIGVHSGLIVAAQTESELAGVIAHEIGHVSQRHIARMIDDQRNSMAITIGSLLLALLAARAGSGNAAAGIAMGGQAAMIQRQLGYSRSAEREADRVGLNSLANAGFDPKGMENFFARLQQNNRYYESASPAYLSTHPLTVERISDMENRTQQIGSKTHNDSLDFSLIQQRMRVLQETTHDDRLRIEKEIRNDLAKAKNKREKIAFTYGLSVANRLLGKGAEAKKYANEAVNLGGKHPILEKNQSECLFLYGNSKEKQTGLLIAKNLVENNPLSQMAVKLYANELYEQKKYQEVLKFMRSQQAISRQSEAYNAIAARCYKELNQKSAHHQAVGDMYLARGDKRAAEYQFNLAQQANDGDYYLMSQVDAKLRQTRQEIVEDEKFKSQ